MKKNINTNNKLNRNEKGEKTMKKNTNALTSNATKVTAAEEVKVTAAVLEQIDEAHKAIAATERIKRNGVEEAERLANLTDARDWRKVSNYIKWLAKRNAAAEHVAAEEGFAYEISDALAHYKMVKAAARSGNAELFPWYDRDLFDEVAAEIMTAYATALTKASRKGWRDTFVIIEDAETKRRTIQTMHNDVVECIALNNLFKAMFRAADGVLNYRKNHAAETFETIQTAEGETMQKDIVHTESGYGEVETKSVIAELRRKLSHDDLAILQALAGGASKKQVCAEWNIGRKTPYTMAQIERLGGTSDIPKKSKFMVVCNDGKVFIASITTLNRRLEKIHRMVASVAPTAAAILQEAEERAEVGGMVAYKPISAEHCTKLEYLKKKTVRKYSADYVKEARTGVRRMPQRTAYTIPKAYKAEELTASRRRDIKAAFEDYTNDYIETLTAAK